MSEQIVTILKKKLEELAPYGELDAETRRNALKEELQYFVLDFIYHHPEYSKWVMYGGSALRIIHGLDRMSVDLDFEVGHTVTEKFLEGLKTEIEEHFANTYGAGSDFLSLKITTGRGLLLKFIVGNDLSSGHPSKQVHIKIDLNHFVAPKTVTERRPMNRDQMSFVILTYNMSSLMASKIAAIFLRGTRGVGQAVYEEKGRDIYDLLWYMTKKVVPDFDYLIAKGIDVSNPRALFDKLTLQMNKVSDENLKQDLSPLFVNQTFVTNWLANWRESYLRLLDSYGIRKVISLEHIRVFQDFRTDTFFFIYDYSTEEGEPVHIQYAISDYWIHFRDGDLPIERDISLDNKIEFGANGSSSRPASEEKLRQYATLFARKTRKYLDKTGNVILGNIIRTKVIRMTAENLNQKEEILLNKSALLSCELDDLLK
ncbi:MAG: nucleotidyl transferase AbiEii/AbiGii toxin family protein [Patescibacteria group bacterium]